MGTVICPPAASIPTERGNVEEEVLGLFRRVAAEDGGLDSSTKGNSLVGVDRLVQIRWH